MLDDQSIWDAIGKAGHFCSFKMKTDTDTLCRNANNVSGLCSRESCPLANSKYATVREIKDKLYLLLKEPERAHKPKALYEKILLDEDYDTALEQIETELRGWAEFSKHKCKQRLTKLTDYLERKSLLDEMGRPIYTHRKKKAERQDRAREVKAVRAAKIEQVVEKEILERYKTGVYGNRTLLEQEKKSEQDIKREKLHQRLTHGIKYVTEFEDDEEEEQSSKAKKKLTLEW
ncbi:protein MAK16 [Nematocida displodere]|uniref:Protein MAK16 n=1 Tax=Nematocida displodere TaxID=1805483 RepID=A0A177EBZ8_9MICR|nr:protein MAK16 [Nematocida displodere]